MIFVRLILQENAQRCEQEYYIFSKDEAFCGAFSAVQILWSRVRDLIHLEHTHAHAHIKARETLFKRTFLVQSSLRAVLPRRSCSASRSLCRTFLGAPLCFLPWRRRPKGRHFHHFRERKSTRGGGGQKRRSFSSEFRDEDERASF